MRKVFILFIMFCLICTGCSSKGDSLPDGDSQTIKLTNSVIKKTEVLEALYQKYRRDHTLDAEVEMSKVQLGKVLSLLNKDLEKMKELYRGEPAYHLDTMLKSMPIMIQSVEEKDLMLFEQGYALYMNGYFNFIDLVNKDSNK